MEGIITMYVNYEIFSMSQKQISWGNRRLLSVVLLWKQYKGMCTLYAEDR